MDFELQTGSKMAPESYQKLQKTQAKKATKNDQKMTPQEPVLANEREARKKDKSLWNAVGLLCVCLCVCVQFATFCVHLHVCESM